MFFVSCSTVPRGRYIEPEFQEDLTSFVTDAANYSVEVDISTVKILMVDLIEFNTNLYGYCDLPLNTIMIFKPKYESLSKLQKKYLLYHELGHCVLQRKHIQGRLDLFSVCPVSIMSGLAYDHCYQTNGEYYIRELFQNPHNGELFKNRSIY
jgi:hypothetical protein